jgi:putative heme iron utilization protein
MSAVAREAAVLIRTHRWAALATLDAGEPEASMVAYACAPDGALLLFLSHLARHTRHLIEHPQAALAVSEPDHHQADPQLLRRATLRGKASVMGRESAEFASCAAEYVARFPDAGPRLGLGDFRLFKFVPEEVRYVGGFARAAQFTWAEILAADGQ